MQWMMEQVKQWRGKAEEKSMKRKINIILYISFQDSIFIMIKLWLKILSFFFFSCKLIYCTYSYIFLYIRILHISECFAINKYIALNRCICILTFYTEKARNF